MRQKTCCFTGHRTIPPEKYMYIKSRLDEEIDRLIQNGITDFCSGGALGFDTIAAMAVLQRKAQNPNVRLIMVLPCSEQANSWSQTNRQNYEEILRRADEVEYVSEHYTNYCMQLRNRTLVDKSSVCIAYFEKKTGGTAYTVKYAQKSQLKVINIIE